jgi:hypothetical protein
MQTARESFFAHREVHLISSSPIRWRAFQKGYPKNLYVEQLIITKGLDKFLPIALRGLIFNDSIPAVKNPAEKP